MSILDGMKWFFKDVVIDIPVSILRHIKISGNLTMFDYTIGIIVIGIVVSVFWRVAKINPPTSGQQQQRYNNDRGDRNER